MCFLLPVLLFFTLPSQIMKMEIQFLSQLEISPYHNDYFILDDDYYVRINNKNIIIKKSFVTDFASVPRILTPIFPVNDTKTIEPALIHDYLYRYHDFNRKESDDIFYHALLKKKYPKWKAFCMWAGVRLFGFQFWQ